jgi:hypothetical protein
MMAVISEWNSKNKMDTDKNKKNRLRNDKMIKENNEEGEEGGHEEQDGNLHQLVGQVDPVHLDGVQHQDVGVGEGAVVLVLPLVQGGLHQIRQQDHVHHLPREQAFTVTYATSFPFPSNILR